VVHDGVERHRQRRLEAEDYGAERIANEKRVDSRAIEQPCHRRVVGGQHHDLLACAFAGGKVGNTKALHIHD
jgi:hypothetical protein